MTFADLLPGDAVFVDANILVYHFAPDPFFKLLAVSSCSVSRTRKSRALRLLHILSEVAHRLLTLEARAQHRWSSGKLIQRLKQNPGVLQKLTKFRAAIAGIVQSRIVVLAATPALLVTASGLCQQPGLLITDALSIALMQANGLTKIASDDADFDRVPGITRYAPV